jgi:hypothetical protein
VWNRLYRKASDYVLARRHRLADYLFSIVPIEGARLQRILDLAQRSIVELETHPVHDEEHRFLMSDELLERTKTIHLGSFAALLARRAEAGL